MQLEAVGLETPEHELADTAGAQLAAAAAENWQWAEAVQLDAVGDDTEAHDCEAAAHDALLALTAAVKEQWAAEVQFDAARRFQN